jgi:hypothetical protein
MGPPLRWGRGWSSYVGGTFIARWFQHEYIRAVMATRSLWNLRIICHRTILSNIYRRWTEVSCQWKLVGQVMHATTLKLQIVSWTVAGLTAAKFKPLILRMPWLPLLQYQVHLDLHGLGFILHKLYSHTRKESHVQFADWCVPVKVSNSAEYSVLQALQFQEVNVSRMITDGTGISHNSHNQNFVRHKFNICT